MPIALKSPETNGRDFFDRIYQQDLAQEAEWLRLTAAAKVKSIANLIKAARTEVGSLLEVGCGTGAVLRECKRQALAKSYSAIDYSETAIGHLNRADPSIRTLQADITSADFRFDEPVDLIVCSHVIEHLERPEAFLAAISQRISFKHAIFEVPLEDLLGHRLRWRGRVRTENSAGHVQFFTADSFERLLERNGLRILARRRYVPRLSYETVSLVARRHRLNGTQKLRKWLTSNAIPGLAAPLWSRLYYAHYAVLCVKA